MEEALTYHSQANDQMKNCISPKLREISTQFFFHKLSRPPLPLGDRARFFHRKVPEEQSAKNVKNHDFFEKFSKKIFVCPETKMKIKHSEAKKKRITP